MADVFSIENIFVYLSQRANFEEFVGFVSLVMRDDLIMTPPVMEFRHRTAAAAAPEVAAAAAEEPTFVMMIFVFKGRT